MTTRLTKPVTRLIEHDGEQWNITLRAEGIELRPHRSRSPLLLPYGNAIIRAATLKADQNRRVRRRVSRSVL